MASPEQICYVLRSGIFVYPISEFEYLQKKSIYNLSVIKMQKWYIEVNNNGRITIFDKKISKDEINESVAKTIIFYYNKLTEKNNG
jgi:hypothetical protein